ncbi:MAG: HDOD domain-containing protein [Planctomycetaceae bacterium]|jgi:serine/threonine-protein kinase
MSTTCAPTTGPASQEAPKLQWSELRSSALESIKTQEIPDNIELPALPQAVTEFVDQSANPDFEFQQLAAIIEKDAGLTCELLRYVNSAAIGLSTAIGNVAQALSHLGINTARTYLMAAGVKAATRSQQSRLLNPRHFWNTSLQRGLFARAVGQSLKLDSGLCFMGGLLQDFLLPVLTNRFDSEYIAYMELNSREGRDLCDWEQETFGWDHAKAGACVAHAWRFPDDLLCALFYHHELKTTLQRPEMEFFNLFPVTCAALLPDQLTQTTSGIRELIRVDGQCSAINLDSLCNAVDEQQMQQAEGYEIPHHLQKLVEEERNRMTNESSAGAS